jgi:hypothetical protein
MNMEDLKKKNGAEMNDKEIIFSKSIKAGKRIYYLDVKKNRKDEMFLAITESKKVVIGEGENVQVNFEKHKIFLYKEDFDKFLSGLSEAITFVNENDLSGDNFAHEKEMQESEGEIKIELDFDEPTL